MSRLDSFIRRLTAQRDVLNFLCPLLPDGGVLELGLGNGRTYDHLRERLPGRRIVAFDRALVAHERSRPPLEDLVLGEIAETAARFSGFEAALVHADIETAYQAIDDETRRWLSTAMPVLLRQGGLAASGLALADPRLERLDLPLGVPADRYFIYRRL